jgi:tRNA pseudouridine13 synthase
VRIFLTDSSGEQNEEAVAARKRLSEEMNFKEALDYFPVYLKYEIMVLRALANNPTDYANAIRTLPRAITLMFVHSVESEIFNRELEIRVKDGNTNPKEGELICLSDKFGFPDLTKTATFHNQEPNRCFPIGNIVGYNSEKLTEEESKILEEMGISKEDFKVKHMPELNCKGTYRPLFAPYTNIKLASVTNPTISFLLPAGSYATVLLSEFLEAP